jgi:CheY-like chemotaxis protein
MLSASDPNPQASRPHERPRAHLLVVEDEPTIRQLFSTLLEASGYSVAQAKDGFAALEQIRKRRPALILSDLNMPRMTGFELLSIIRRRFPQIHVIAMSGGFSGDSIPDGVAADAFYEKSGRSITTLVEVIERILEEPVDAAAKPERPARVTPSGELEPLPRTIQAEAPVALWVTQRGTPINGPYALLTCSECLRSFPHFAGEESPMRLQETACIFCGAPVAYAFLDPMIAHHPGYAPTGRYAANPAEATNLPEQE